MKKFLNKTALIFTMLIGLAAINCTQQPVIYEASLVNGGTHIVGKSVFEITITDSTTGEKTPGVNIEVLPWMTMAAMEHGTPVESVTDLGDGNYRVVAYYLMPTNTVTGDTWEIIVKAEGSEIARLPVTVTGSMMDRGLLKGINDKIMMNSMAANRNYFIFTSTTITGSTVDLYLATRETMSNHPAVFSGQSLLDETSKNWTVGSVQLDLCTSAFTYDSVTPATSCGGWTTLTDQGDGHFTGNIPAASSGGLMPVFGVRLNVVNATAGNNEWKTKDGIAAANTAFTATAAINYK